MKTNKEIKRLNLLRFGAKWAVTLTSSLPLLKALHRVRSLAAGCFSFLLILSSLHGAVPPEPQAPPPDDAPGIKGESAPTPAKAPPGSRAFQPAAAPAIGGAWQAQGPGPTRNGQVENIVPNNEVAGSIHALAPHPTDASILFAGAVNGGVWRTRNATASSPNWTPLTDGLSSLSIGALAFDPTDPTHNTLVAGVGRHSSFAQRGGPRTGIQRTTDGGDSWVEIDGAGVLLGKNISGIAARGSVLMVAVNVADVNTHPNVGLFRSTDTGVTFTQVSGSGSGLPLGLSHDLAGDRHRSQVLYTDVSQSSPAGGNGIYKSTDSGANWVRVSSSAMDALITSQTSNIEIAVGTNETVYVGIINGGRLVGVFRSGDGGATWVQMDTPVTHETGGDVGINPNPSGNSDPGGQGSIHFSIVADPTDTNLVYVGGDRQPRGFNDTGSFPNSIGANDFSGRLFRGNASQPAGSQWVHLTHSSTLGAAGGGTASSSSPHADSRDAEFDANGVLIEGNDGGIYKRTSPRNNTGDWFSICGDIQPTEFHNIAYDANARVIVGGAQDTGTPREIAPGGTTWNSVSTADGGDVAIDVLSQPGSSIQYSSFQNLAAFRRNTYDAANNLVSTVFPSGANSSFSKQFVTPVVLNAINPVRLVIGGALHVYESLNRGDTVSQVTLGGAVSKLAYGGRKNGVDNADVLYATRGSSVFIRTASGGALIASGAPFPGGTIEGLVLDPTDWATAFVADSDQVFMTTTAGGSWTEITGDLGQVGTIRALAYMKKPGSPALVVGAQTGVFVSFHALLGTWKQLGTGLPKASVYDLSHGVADDVLIAGTLGRGAFKLTLGTFLSAAELGLASKTLSGGNGDASVDFNECNTLNITLTNVGNSTAASIMATLSSTTPGVTIRQPASAYSDLAPNASGANLTPFKIETSPGFVCGTVISCVLTVVTTSDGTFTFPFQLPSGSGLGSATGFDSADVPKPLVDTGTANSVTTVSGLAGAIGKVTVSLHLTHTYDGDLIISLIAPNGATVTLASGRGGSADNYGTSCSSFTLFDDAAGTAIGSGTAPFVGSFRPDQALSVFNGLSPAVANGAWTLRIQDTVAQDTGTLQCWSLSISPATCTDGGGPCQQPTTTTVASSQNPSVSGQSVTFTATVDGGGAGTPTGMVIFTVDGMAQAPVALNGSGQVTLTTSTLTVGSHSVSVSYLGDDNFAGSMGTLAGGQTVNAASTTTTVASLPNPSLLGQNVTFTATVASVAPGAGTPTGTATFTLDSVAQSPVALNGAGQATLMTSALTAGSHSITAAYNGDTRFNASSGNAVNQSVNTADYVVTTTGNAVVVTDVAGNSDTLGVFTPSGGLIRFVATPATRTFSVNGGALITGNSGDLSLAGINSITVNAGAGTDIINVGALIGQAPGFVPATPVGPAGPFLSLTLNGGTGDDTVNFNGDITFIANANLDVDLQNDDPVPGSDRVILALGANIITGGAGTIVVKVSRSVLLNSGSSFETSNGGITIEANQQLATTGGDFSGVTVVGLIRATGTGVVAVRGRGGDAPTGGQRGVYVAGGGSIVGGTAGLLTVEGTGGVSIGGSNRGVHLDGLGSTINSGGASVRIIGQGGGTGASTSDPGVFVNNSGLLTAGGNGTVTVQGASGPGFGSAGVLIGSQITSSGGALQITGIEGAAVGNVAIRTQNPATLSTISQGGSITLIGNSMSIDATAVISAQAGSSVTLRPYTAGTNINLGSGADPIGGPLSLSDVELDRITAGTLIIGDANSGNITVSAAISPANVAALSLVTPGTIADTFTGGTDVTVASLTTSNNLAPGASPGLFSVAGNHTLADNSTFTVEIGGTVAGTGYDQLSASGSVTIGANVTLSTASFSGFTPSPGQSFTIISRTGGSGTFATLPEGATVSMNFLGAGVPAHISYTGGDGDDVVLMLESTPPLVTCPASIATNIVNGTDTVTVNYTTPTATGIPTPVVVCAPASGSPFSVGQTTVTCTATNLAGTNVCTFTVTACATNIIVLNNNNAGAGSLRQAIADLCPGGSIAFAPALNGQTIVLTSGELVINKGMTIAGLGATNLAVSGNNASRVFLITSPGIVNLSGLTIANANTNNFGGGILSSSGGLLNITGCAITNCTAHNGGGISFAFGTLNLLNSTFSGNQTMFQAGGLNLFNCVANVSNCTFSANTAGSIGGAILNLALGQSTLTLANCTIAGNNSGSNGAVQTFARINAGAMATTRVLNTLVVGNTSSNFFTVAEPGTTATLVSLAHNLDSDGSSGFTSGVNGDLVGTLASPLDAKLGPLAHNGGPTRTHALLPGSPAINAGEPAFNTNNLAYDQRGPGYPRVVGGRVDIGAFEALDLDPSFGCLISQWRFDETSGLLALDSAGGNLGALVNGPVRKPGRVGSGALQLDGVDDFVRIPDHPSLRLTTNWSVSMWFKPSQLLNASSGRRDLFKKFASYWLLFNYPGNDGKLAFVFNTGSPILKTTTSSWPANEWQHVAATYDGALMRLYINGVLEAATATNNAIPNANTAPVEIGGSTEYRNFYPGCVDDVRIFCTNLAPATVLALFNGSVITPPPPPPVNTPPVISDIPNITMITNTTSLQLPFITSDGQTPNAALIVTATSDNPTLLPNANIFLADYISNRVVQVTPAPNQAGFATVTVTVSDGVLSTNDTFTVSVMAPVPPTTGCLISHWNFNEASGNTAFDAVNGNPGTLVGSPVRAPGLSGGALFFNGENNYVNVPDSDSLDLTNQFSISLWFQPGTLLNASSGRRDLLQKFLSYWFIINYPGNDGRLAFVLNSGAPLVKSTTASWTAGQWYHAVSTYDGIQLKLYINGVLEASAPASVLPVKNTSPLLIGGNISQVSYFPGGLDEVRLYGCALTAGDITGLYNQGGSTTPPPPNTRPTISDIADRSIAANSNTGDIPFTVNDAQTSPGSLWVTATSGNTTLVPNANLLLGGSAGARMLRVTPSPGLTGSALITVTVSDGALATNDTFLLTVTNAPPPPPLGTNQLISRWQFDEPDSITALDLAGLNPGTLVNGPLRVPGTIGSGALQFDGGNDHVNVPDSTSLDLSNRFTIALWFKPSVLLNGTSGRKDLLQKFLSYWILLNYPANDGRLSFVLNSGSPYARSTTTTWNANQWYHLAATYDGVTMKLYINGVLEGTAPSVFLPANTANPLQFGGNTTQGYWFPGAMDDVRLYGSPLTPDAITAVMGGLSPLLPPGGLVTTSPSLAITVESENDLVVLKWSAQAGRTYRVEYTDDLTGGDWTALPGTVTVSGGAARTEDTLGLSTQRFYRVVIEP